MAICHDMAGLDFIIPNECDVLVSWLSGRLMYKHNVADPISFKFYSQCVLEALQKSEARKLSLPLDVVQMTTWIQWQPPTWKEPLTWEHPLTWKQPLTGIFLMRPLTCEHHETLSEKNDTSLHGPYCFICFASCVDAGDWFSNTSPIQNCVRCLPCFLCPNCKVLVNGTPVCYHCLEDVDYTRLNGLSDICWKRLSVLSLLDAEDM